MIIPELKAATDALKEQLRTIPDDDEFFDLVKSGLAILGETGESPRATLNEYLSLYTEAKSKDDLLNMSQEEIATLRNALAPMMEYYGIPMDNMNGGTRRKQRGGVRWLVALLFSAAAVVMGGRNTRRPSVQPRAYNPPPGVDPFLPAYVLGGLAGIAAVGVGIGIEVNRRARAAQAAAENANYNAWQQRRRRTARSTRQRVKRNRTRKAH
jgi:hypothetical protein